MFETDASAFLTGSHAYGTPREDSDIDIVLTLSDGDIGKLKSLCDKVDSHEELPDDGNGYDKSLDVSLRFGRLNLLVVPPAKFVKWKRANDVLCQRHWVGESISRAEAKRVILESINNA